MQHEKKYVGVENGGGKIVCACGWESPTVDDSMNFTLGRKQRSVESYFEEHLANVSRGVESAMIDPAQERAVAPAQKPLVKKGKK